MRFPSAQMVPTKNKQLVSDQAFISGLRISVVMDCVASVPVPFNDNISLPQISWGNDLFLDIKSPVSHPSTLFSTP